MKTIAFMVIIAAWLSCASETSGGPDIDMIRERLDKNACRIAREDLIFEIGELEFINDTTYTEIPLELLSDTVTVCPVTLELYTMVSDNGDRKIVCPNGHGETEF